MNLLKFIPIIFALFVASGCAIVAPQYQPDFHLINDLKDTKLSPMKTGDFSGDASTNEIVVRASPMSSPYNNSYAEYLKKALEEDLKQSGHWDANSKIVISGVLIKNELDASGFDIGFSDISAKFVVSKNNNVVYDKIHTIHHEWESSFIGAVAIPNGQNNYSVSIQKLLREFFTDGDLLTALKK